ncbi:nitrogen permease regulator 2 [Rhizodiscina lignyota]|uniref:Nitrogen permease regulator 2 n=1 Tax=Rhizodiscina lignyota TaxID=1504668 RepID=A0A9P4M6Z7_9PEZI|nr:nitrogen permease regulator 2 [Rhizodiscina lignyota]
MEPSTPKMRAIFFTRFHPKKGSRVLHQVPEYSITPAPASSSNTYPTPLFNFADISDFIIPHAEFFDRLLTVRIGEYRVIGYPVCIEDSKRYDRNQFIFNLAIVLDERADMSAHKSVVQKLARLLKNLEEQSSFLSNEEDERLWDRLEGSGLHPSATMASQKGEKVYALCEMILEDLNNYGECMIPIDDANTVQLKLFPTRPPPAPVHAWHVPLLTIQPSLLGDESTSDLTLKRIVPFIDGIRSIARIAKSADVDLSLARKAIQHLLYYNCIILLDIFQFAAVYAPTPEIRQFVVDEEAQDEAINYISVGQYMPITATEAPTLCSSHAGTPKPSPSGRWEWNPASTSLNRVQVVQLYTSLKQGLPLRAWCVENETLLAGIDVRRFITFGIIKGFLYRVHRYAWADIGKGKEMPDLPLAKYLDGQHCFDEICTELEMSEKEVLAKMKAAYGDVVLISK